MRTMRVRTTSVAGFLWCAIFAIVGPAAAQGPPPSTRHEPWLLGTAGLGSMTPLYADDYSEGPVYLGGVRLSPSPRFSIEGEVTYRTATRASDRVNVTLPDFNCPLGQPCQVGHADRDLYQSTTSDWTAGVNLLRRFPVGRAAVFAGGGFMFHEESLEETRTLTNCTNPGHVSAAFVDCAGFDHGSSSQGLGFQGLVGLDVAIASHLQAYGGVRYEIRNDLGYGTFGVTGGVRVALR